MYLVFECLFYLIKLFFNLGKFSRDWCIIVRYLKRKKKLEVNKYEMFRLIRFYVFFCRWLKIFLIIVFRYFWIRL